MQIMKILYGCCYKGIIGLNRSDVEIDYIDILDNIDKPNGKYIKKDIRDINFNDYDLILCSPPCNYWCRGNYRREISSYALKTKDLLPWCIDECIKSGKPFIIENVLNHSRFLENGLFNKSCFYHEYGRHTYFTNRFFVPSAKQSNENITFITKSKRQGSDNVNKVFDEFIDMVLSH